MTEKGMKLMRRLIMHKTANATEAQENVAKVQEKILEEDSSKKVDGEDEDSYASAFADSGFHDEEDTGTRIEPESHKEHPKTVYDDDNNVDKQMKNDDVEKKNNDVNNKKDDQNDDDDDHDDHALIKNTEMSNTLNHLVPELTVDKTNELMEEAISRMVNDAIEKDREIFVDVVPELVSKEFATYAPKIIEELFKRYMKNKVLNVHPTFSIFTTTTIDLKKQLYLKMKIDL
nr:hypothetical protein [Tanacetum cinerariifolium]